LTVQLNCAKVGCTTVGTINETHKKKKDLEGNSHAVILVW